MWICSMEDLCTYVSTDTTADAASWSTLAASILALEQSEQKVWMHIKLCLGN